MKQIRPKRPLTAILVLVLAFCLIFIVACGNTETDPDDKKPGAPGDTVTPGDMTDPDDGDGNDPDGGDDLGGDLPGDVPGDVPGDTTDPDDGNESETTETESDFTFTLSATKDHYIVTGYVGEGGAATIPAEYDGLPVKQIDSLGSTTAHKILTLNIPDPVETIGVEAFKFCYSLISVRLPISLTSIGMRAFRHSYNLFEICNDSNISLTPGSSSNGGVAKYAKNIYSSDLGESKLTSDGGYTFYDDAEGSFLAAYTGTDTELTLPRVTPNGNPYDVAMNAFLFFSAPTAIDMSAAEISELGGNTNGTLRSLTSVTLPETLKSVGQRFFENSKISEIDLPDGLETIGNYAFSGCSSLSSISLPQSLTDIGIEAFKETAIANAEIPSQITYLKNGLFENCTALESADLPEALKQIGDKVFKGAEKLAAVNMPSGVTDIGAEAFYGCKDLTGFVDSDGVVRFYLPEGITAVSDGCFAYCPLKTSFTIPDQILSIGDAAFKNTYLKELTISESLKSIGAEAFSGSELKVLTVPDSLESLGEKAFAAGKFTSATVPVKFIYNIRSWLDHAAILESLTVTGTGTVGHNPDGVAVSAPLDEYGYIEKVIIEDTVTGIGEAAFAGLGKLKTVTIGDGVKTIGNNAFGLDGKGCYMLETVNIGSGVSSIGEKIFAGWHTENRPTGKLTVNYAGGKIDWDRVSKRSNWYFDVSKTKLVMNYSVDF